MATSRTVRQVKQEERLRRSQQSVGNFISVEVESYGSYKPVPPPKPLSTSTPNQTALLGNGTPPPYRMPPYHSIYEASLPGQVSGASDATAGASSTYEQFSDGSVQFHVHSNKFPIEREVIIANGEKNLKIPILNDFKKRAKTAIAPDAPPKQSHAWVQSNGLDSNYSTHNHSIPSTSHHQQQQFHDAQYRLNYHPHVQSNHCETSYPEEIPPSVCNGGTPRIAWQHNGNSHDGYNDRGGKNEATTSKSELSLKDLRDKNLKSVTKTYQSIKGMISSRFKGSSKEIDVDKSNDNGETVLNNMMDRQDTQNKELLDHKEEERQIQSILKKPVENATTSATIYGQCQEPRLDRLEGMSPQQKHQFNQKQQQLLQQQMLKGMQLQPNQQYGYSPHAGASSLNGAMTSLNGALNGVPNGQSCLNSGSSGDPNRFSNGGSNGLGNSGQNGAAMHMQRAQDSYQKFQEVKNEQAHCSQFQREQTQIQRIMEQNNFPKDGFYHNHGYVRDGTTGTGTPGPRRFQQNDPKKPQQFEVKADVNERFPPNHFHRERLLQTSQFADARRTASQPHLIIHAEQEAAEKQLLDPLTRRGSCDNIIETFARPAKTTSDNEEKERVQSNQSEKNDDARVDLGLMRHQTLEESTRTRLEGEIGKIEGVYNIHNAGLVEKLDLAPRMAANAGSATSGSDYDKMGGHSSSNVDSGRGSAAYSSGRPDQRPDDTSPESSEALHSTKGRDDWVDVVETELRQILEPKMRGLSLQNGAAGASTMSDSASSITPPLPPLSPGDNSTPTVTPRNSTRYNRGSSLPYSAKYNQEMYKSGGKNPAQSGSRWTNGTKSRSSRSGAKNEYSSKSSHLYGLDLADIASTTTRSVDVESSMLDGQSDSDEDLNVNDAREIRKQLEGLESMYSEVLKLLGVKKYSNRYQPSDPRYSKRRYGSMSSLPSSSVSSRPIRDKRGRVHEAERKKVRDMRSINKRFQRLESHVVTLARSVAHLSSEMRTQHLMIQEMENIREEIAALRTQTTIMAARQYQPVSKGFNVTMEAPSMANPSRVKKLTKFFGSEPPLLRLFLRELGYEKYATAFENEGIGMVELPYVSEERLQKIGIPLGPRLRILQEAQISVCKDTTLCIV